MDWYPKFVNRAINFFTGIGAIFLIATMLLMVANIIYRFFGGAIPGVHELVGPFISVTASFALGYTVLTGDHVIMDIIITRCPRRFQAIAKVFCSLISIVFCIFLAWCSARFTWDRFLAKEVTTWLEVPLFPFRGYWMLGIIFFCLAFVVELLRSWRWEENK